MPAVSPESGPASWPGLPTSHAFVYCLPLAGMAALSKSYIKGHESLPSKPPHLLLRNVIRKARRASPQAHGTCVLGPALPQPSPSWPLPHGPVAEATRWGLWMLRSAVQEARPAQSRHPQHLGRPAWRQGLRGSYKRSEIS